MLLSKFFSDSLNFLTRVLSVSPYLNVYCLITSFLFTLTFKNPFSLANFIFDFNSLFSFFKLSIIFCASNFMISASLILSLRTKEIIGYFPLFKGISKFKEL